MGFADRIPKAAGSRSPAVHGGPHQDSPEARAIRVGLEQLSNLIHNARESLDWALDEPASRRWHDMGNVSSTKATARLDAATAFLTTVRTLRPDAKRRLTAEIEAKEGQQPIADLVRRMANQDDMGPSRRFSRSTATSGDGAGSDRANGPPRHRAMRRLP